MSNKLPSNASVTMAVEGPKLHAPSAARNAGFLCDLLATHASRDGVALEIASGTGQHVVQFAQALPYLTWQPTEIDGARRVSIDAYASEVGMTNIHPARLLDATQPGWHTKETQVDLVIVINLLHLIGATPARVLLAEAMALLRPQGRFVVYGPFKRNGQLTSDGDAQFDADLRAADPDIGYKNDHDIDQWLIASGAMDVQRIDMPANNLAFVATKG